MTTSLNLPASHSSSLPSSSPFSSSSSSSPFPALPPLHPSLLAFASSLPSSSSSALSLSHVHGAREWYSKSLGSPRFIVAPMVNQSELAFRLLCRKYGAQLCYTPMIHSKLTVNCATYRQIHWHQQNYATVIAQHSPSLDSSSSIPPPSSSSSSSSSSSASSSSVQGVNVDRPLFAQICGHDPSVMLEAATLIADDPNPPDAIDVNFGCPQGIAKRGMYGSFLLTSPVTVHSIIRTLSSGLAGHPSGVRVTAKMRLLPSLDQSLFMARLIEASGASLLTVHGRTREQNKERVGSNDFETIRLIRQALHIPVISNGGIYNLDEVNQALEFTQADAVMTSEAILENPALFTGDSVCPLALAREYLSLARQFPTDSSCIRAHLFKVCHRHLAVYTDLRQQLGSLSADLFEQFLDKLTTAHQQATSEQLAKFAVTPTWYFRYQHNPKNALISNTTTTTTTTVASTTTTAVTTAAPITTTTTVTAATASTPSAAFIPPANHTSTHASPLPLCDPDTQTNSNSVSVSLSTSKKRKCVDPHLAQLNTEHGNQRRYDDDDQIVHGEQDEACCDGVASSSSC